MPLFDSVTLKSQTGIEGRLMKAKLVRAIESRCPYLTSGHAGFSRVTKPMHQYSQPAGNTRWIETFTNTALHAARDFSMNTTCASCGGVDLPLIPLHP